MSEPSIPDADGNFLEGIPPCHHEDRWQINPGLLLASIQGRDPDDIRHVHATLEHAERAERWGPEVCGPCAMQAILPLVKNGTITPAEVGQGLEHIIGNIAGFLGHALFPTVEPPRVQITRNGERVLDCQSQDLLEYIDATRRLLERIAEAELIETDVVVGAGTAGAWSSVGKAFATLAGWHDLVIARPEFTLNHVTGRCCPDGQPHPMPEPEGITSVLRVDDTGRPTCHEIYLRCPRCGFTRQHDSPAENFQVHPDAEGRPM